MFKVELKMESRTLTRCLVVQRHHLAADVPETDRIVIGRVDALAFRIHATQHDLQRLELDE